MARRRAGLAMPFETVHLDERSPEVAGVCPSAPCVLAHSEDGVVLLLGPAEIDACAGSVDALLAAVGTAAAARGLSLAPADSP